LERSEEALSWALGYCTSVCGSGGPALAHCTGETHAMIGYRETKQDKHCQEVVKLADKSRYRLTL